MRWVNNVIFLRDNYIIIHHFYTKKIISCNIISTDQNIWIGHYWCGQYFEFFYTTTTPHLFHKI